MKIVIIGAGLSGLTAAYELVKRGLNYTILEGRNRPGGRIHTIKTKSGYQLELGAAWFAKKHKNLFNMIEELGIAYEPQYQGSKILYDYYKQGRVIQEVPTNHDGE